MGRKKNLQANFISDYFVMYINQAKGRGLDFSLTENEFYKITSSNCFYCGSAPEPKRVSGGKKQNRTFFANGIDRVDSDIGYIPSNCVPCCEFCNRAKRNYTVGFFLSKVAGIYHYCELNPINFI